jgi:REP element-mobilizing transposase RayT
LMPDHIHFFYTTHHQQHISVKSWTTYLKRQMTIHMDNPIEWKWQNDCWDTQMRDIDHYLEKLEYMRLNPVRARFVERAEDWHYAGSLNDIVW